MHAASAGEAGRGFAVVADEVQRLAQSARDATAQIATLVSSIQTETADTVTTMNEAITRVVSGSQLAEEAGAEMHNTRESTAELVRMVQVIAKDSQHQAAATRRLQESAEGIRSSTEQTYQQLQDQLTHSDQLAVLAARLLAVVSVFTLPDGVVSASNDGAATPEAEEAADTTPEVAATA
jgi:methyl-accepting chemotaxis protein